MGKKSAITLVLEQKTSDELKKALDGCGDRSGREARKIRRLLREKHNVHLSKRGNPIYENPEEAFVKGYWTGRKYTSKFPISEYQTG